MPTPGGEDRRGAEPRETGWLRGGQRTKRVNPHMEGKGKRTGVGAGWGENTEGTSPPPLPLQTLVFSGLPAHIWA